MKLFNGRNNLLLLTILGIIIVILSSVIATCVNKVLAADFIVDAQVVSGIDDAYDAPVCCWPGTSVTDSLVYAGAPGSGNTHVYGGWRWTGLGVPPGAQVIAAWIELQQAYGGNPTITTLYGEDSVVPQTFSVTDSPADRLLTMASVNWSWSPASAGAWHRSPSLVPVIQELVSRYGGMERLAIIEDGTLSAGMGFHYWTSLEGGAAARLHIEYDGGWAVTPTPTPTPVPGPTSTPTPVPSSTSTPSPAPTQCDACEFIAVWGDSEIALNWSDFGIARYDIRRSTTPTGPFIYVGSTGLTAFTDTGLSNRIAHYYWLHDASDKRLIAFLGPVTPLGLAPIRALFIGNSYTEFNGHVYDHVSAFGAYAPGTVSNIYVENCHLGAATLQVHWNSPEQCGQAKLDAGGWDYLVLQDYWWADSNCWANMAPCEANFRAYSQQFADYARQTNPGVHVVLFQTWVHQHGACPSGTQFWQDMQAYVNQAYEAQADALDAVLAPAGTAFQDACVAFPWASLYDADNFHPGLDGTYLASAVIYQVMTGRSPVGNPYQAQSPVYWDELEAVADTEVRAKNLDISGVTP